MTSLHKLKSSGVFLAWLSLLLFTQTDGAVLAPPRDSDLELVILHNNDMHARFEQTSQLSSICSDQEKAANNCYGGFARVAHLVREARKKAAAGEAPPVLYLNAGDTYTGTIWFAVYKWKIAADFVNIIKPDAVSLGNHELDNGVSGLTPFIKNLSCPVVAANLILKGEPEFNDVTNLKKSIVLEVQNRKIGIIGYLTPDTQFLVSPNNINYIDEVISIQEEADKLKSEGVNIIIALGHSGYETDKRIAKEVQGVDLVIGGHTNTFLWNGKTPDIEQIVGAYPTIIQQSSGKNVPVVQAYAYTKYLGKLHLKFDNSGEIISYDGQPILLDHSVAQEQDVLDLLETFRPGILNITTNVVGKADVLLTGGGACRGKECNLGNLIADSMVYGYAVDHKTTTGWTDAPIALMHGGGIRTSINPETKGGNITRADILDVLPFDNVIVAVNMTGSVLKRVLEWSAYNYNPIELPGAFLQFSGLRVEYNITNPPGSRLVSAQALCGKCVVPTYSTVSENAFYKVLIPEFLYEGGDNYTMLKTDILEKEILALNDADALSDYINHHSPVSPELQGRVILLAKSGAAQLSTIAGLPLATALYLSISFRIVSF